MSKLDPNYVVFEIIVKHRGADRGWPAAFDEFVEVRRGADGEFPPIQDMVTTVLREAAARRGPP